MALVQLHGYGLGGIQFFHYSENEDCGNGAYHNQLLQLLKAVQMKRSAEFKLSTQSGGGAPKPGLGRYYHAKPFKTFPIETAGEDLAWLITETFPRIQAIGKGG